MTVAILAIAIASACGNKAPSSGTLGESKAQPRVNPGSTPSPEAGPPDAGTAIDAGVVTCDCAAVCDCSTVPERVDAKNRAIDACLLNGGGCRCATCPGE